MNPSTDRRHDHNFPWLRYTNPHQLNACILVHSCIPKCSRSRARYNFALQVVPGSFSYMYMYWFTLRGWVGYSYAHTYTSTAVTVCRIQPSVCLDQVFAVVRVRRILSINLFQYCNSCDFQLVNTSTVHCTLYTVLFAARVYSNLIYVCTRNLISCTAVIATSRSTTAGTSKIRMLEKTFWKMLVHGYIRNYIRWPG